jgi:GAF domain-containing protein
MEAAAMNSLRERLFALRFDYRNPVERQRARALLVLSWVLAVVLVLWVVAAGVPALINGELLSEYVEPSAILTAILIFFVTYSVQRGRLLWASWLFVANLIVSIASPVLTQYQSDDPTMALSILLVIPVVAAGVLLNRRSMIWVGAVMVGLLAGRAYLQSLALNPIRTVPANGTGIDFALLLMSLGLAYLFLYVFNGSGERAVEDALAQIDRMQEIASFPGLVNDVTNEAALLERAIDLQRQRLKYAIAQIYLLDENGNLTRRVRSGLGRQETGAYIQLRVGDANVISDTVRWRKPTLVVEEDERQGHIIPPARSALAIPIIYKDEVLGVLDTQSQNVTFSEEEIKGLELFASQVGAALSQLRLINDLQSSQREQADLASRFQTQLYELRQNSQQVISSGWTRYLEGQGQTAFGYDIVSDGSSPVPASDLPAGMRPAIQQGELNIETNDSEQIINVPIVFRGETLGAMAFAVPKDQPITERQLDMAQTVSNRLSLALENTRLFEQSQAQAFRERKASEVANQLISATDVKAVLNLAAESFHEAMGAIYTRVYLQPELLAEPATQSRGEERS